MTNMLHTELAAQYNRTALVEIAKAAEFHARLVRDYGEDKRYAKVFGDMYLAINAVLKMVND